jgi:general secretion pathway protein D
MNGSNIQVLLNALGTVTHVEVISSPEVMVLNNQMASLEVGDQVPILSGESQSTIDADSPVVNSIEYLDTGIILKVTPRVNRSGQVMMDISQEVSGVDNNATTESTIGSPTIQQRKIESSVSVADGETVALGGLFSDQRTVSRSGIPLLDRIPLVGNLFSNNDDQHNRTELMVLITPHVVDNPEKARAITNELRKKLPEVQPLFDEKG